MNFYDVGQRDFQAASQRPKLMPTFDLKHCFIAIDGYLYHKPSLR
jgi:hypothetical protein